MGFHERTAVALCVAVCTGCASGGFKQVSISAGQDESDYPLAGHTVFVVPNAQMSDTALESRVRGTVEKALLNQGYVLAPPALADLYVMASFGAVDRFALSSLSYVAPATTRTETAPNGATMQKVYPEHMEHPEILSLKNSLAVLISASDAKLFRETGQVKSLWRAEASIPGKAELLRDMVPYLLAPTLTYFGKSSGGLKSVDITNKEARHWQTAK